MTERNPIQPIIKVDGWNHFKPNAIVKHLKDTHPNLDMNALMRMEFSADDRQHFAQLIGMGLTGYATLPYVDDDAWNAVDAIASKGMSETQARIAALEEELSALRLALREPMARLFGVSPEDFKNCGGK